MQARRALEANMACNSWVLPGCVQQVENGHGGVGLLKHHDVIGVRHQLQHASSSVPALRPLRRGKLESARLSTCWWIRSSKAIAASTLSFAIKITTSSKSSMNLSVFSTFSILVYAGCASRMASSLARTAARRSSTSCWLRMRLVPSFSPLMDACTLASNQRS